MTVLDAAAAAGTRALPEPPRRWELRNRGLDTAAVAALTADLSLPEPLCRLLHLRGHTPDSARSFLKPRLDQLHDPLLLAGAADAVARIMHAIRAGERILVHGVYDVD